MLTFRRRRPVPSPSPTHETQESNGQKDLKHALQDTERSGDWLGLIASCGELVTAAKSAGYPALADSATEVSRAAHERHAELAYKALVVLTDVAQRIRRAHRGAL